MSMRNDDEEEEQARAYLLKLFKHRPRSRHEAMARLQQRGFSQTAIETTIEKAERSGILNDARFAKLWVEDRLMRKPKSRRALARELRAKGVSAAQIKDTLARVEIDEATLARQVVSACLPRYSRDDPATRDRKLAGFLRRRGFSYDVIRRVLEHVVG